MYNFLRLASKALASNLFSLREPYKLTFAVTYKCNSRCKICNIWKRKSEKELTTEEIRKFFGKNSFPWINLTGGEVFLRNDVVDIIKSMKGLYLLNITTNGTLTEKILKDSNEIKKIVPKFILSVSIDGPKKFHDEIRGIKCWDRAVETYKKLRENEIESYVCYTISPYNINRFEETYEEIKKIVPDLETRDFHLSFYHESDVYFGNRGGIKRNLKYEKKLEKIFTDFTKLKSGAGPVSFLERKYMKLVKEYLETGKSPLPCKALLSSCFIDPQGNVYPCTIFNEKLGNLREADYDLKKIWDSEKAKEVRKLIKENKCPGCWTPCEAYQTVLGNLMKA